MWLGHVSVPGTGALLLHLATYEQTALGACEGASGYLLSKVVKVIDLNKLLAMGKCSQPNEFICLRHYYG